ncbi:hypothetical protein BC828DRAFT_375512 [Blastocladiella britannica]|nr:hypothetical protein BC828DRAFT_375512 [Blastocladiella britannica]
MSAPSFPLKASGTPGGIYSLPANGGLSLSVILALPIIIAIVLTLALHVYFVKTNAAYKDTPEEFGSTGGSSGSGKPGVGAEEEFLQANPPVAWPTNAAPNFTMNAQNEAPVGSIAVVGGDTFKLKFATGFSSMQLTSLLSLEITVVSKDVPSTILAVGLARVPYPDWRLPGWHPNSFGYHSNGRRFVDRGNYIGQPFNLSTDPAVPIPRAYATKFTLVVNERDGEVYVSQGDGKYKFYRVLATAREWRRGELQYMPVVGTNGRATIMVRPVRYSDQQIQEAKRFAYENEGIQAQLAARSTAAGSPQLPSAADTSAATLNVYQ